MGGSDVSQLLLSIDYLIRQVLSDNRHLIFFDPPPPNAGRFIALLQGERAGGETIFQQSMFTAGTSRGK